MTQLMGILNLTPDSFSDGGVYLAPEAAFGQARQLLEAGAAVIDVGAESTRPGATPVAPEEEWDRLAPILPRLIALVHERGARLSLDTRHAEVAARAVPLKVDWINDVSGFEDPAMVAAVRDAACRLVVMHHLGVPPDPARTLPEADDAVAAVRESLAARVAALEGQGIDRGRLVLDPGIGFGKTPAQSRALLARAGEFKHLGLPVLMGHSRKSFLGSTSQARETGTLAVSRLLVAQGIDFLRVHDVRAHQEIVA